MNTENKNNNQIPVASNSLSSSGVPNNVPFSTNSLQYSTQQNGVTNQQQVNNVSYPSTNVVANNGYPNQYQNQQVAMNPNQQQNLVNATVGQVGITNNATVGSTSVLSNQQGISAQGSVSNNSGVASSTVILNQAQPVSQGVVPSAPVPPKEISSDNTNVLDDKNGDDQHEVVEVLGSSFEKKEKVNLLTPEQKQALTKKREDALKEKANYQPVPVSKFKRVMSVFVIIMLFVIVFFLPDINNYLAEMRNPTKKVDNTQITTGTLKCNLDKVNDKYNLSYSYDFDFTDSKLDQLSYVQATAGDELVDSDELNQRLGSCTKLKEMAGSLPGIKIVCSLSGGVLTEQQVINYKTLNHEQVTTAYIEAGGMFPEFASDTNIDMIERNMKASGYTCERVK